MTRYATDPAAARIAEPLDEIVAVYHRPSGATHLLVAPAPELLDALAQGPADAATLLDRLVRRFDLPERDEAVIVARMEELVEAGLAWRT